MTDLVRELELLGQDLSYPPTPSIAAVVARELEAPGVARRRARAGRRRVLRSALIAALVVLLLAATAIAASREVREFLGLQGATVERVEKLPSAPPRRALDLGDRASLAAAERALGFDVLVPRLDGEPDEVRLRRDGEVALVYEPSRELPRSEPTGLGLLVTEFRGDLAPEYIGKVAAQATLVERLSIGGNRAIWIEGAPHLFFYRPPGGDMRERPLRLAANVLLLERGDLLVRLEGDFGRDEAVRLALSLR